MNVPLAVAPQPATTLASALGRRAHHCAQHCYSYCDDLPAAIWFVGWRDPLLLGSASAGCAEHAVCPVLTPHGTASPPPSRSEA